MFDAVALLALGLAVSFMFFTAPQDGEFWWSDAPRHALNGVFVRDLLADLPLSDPAGYAIDYYVRYPALTILFYPPLFYVFSAPFFAVFGVSPATALLPVMITYFALGAGTYALARRWLGPPAALGAALVLVGAPEIALWGRQVMLEVPSYALLIWSVWALFRHLDGGRPAPLYGAAFLFLCALYVKQSVIFMAPALGLALVLYRGRDLVRDRHAWIAGGLFAIGLIPLAVLMLEFGQANVQSVSGVQDAVVPRDSLAGWLWYLRRLPEQLGWLPLALAAAGLAAMAAAPRWRLPWRDTAILLAWFGIGYLFFSAIDLKEARHSVFILFPVILVAVLFLERLLPPRPAAVATLAFGVGVVAATLAWFPPPSVAGYREAVEFVAARAPRDSVVMFAGKRDGSFIFNMRSHEERPDLAVVRADKMLLRIAVRRELGVQEIDLSEAEIADRINRYGVHYVVAQRDFWTDLAPMARLAAVLASDRFEEVGRIAVAANVPTEDRELVIYRNRGPVAEGGARISIDLPIIGRSVEGTLP